MSLAQMVFFLPLPKRRKRERERESGANVVPPPLWRCLTTEVRRKRGHFNTVAPLHCNVPTSLGSEAVEWEGESLGCFRLKSSAAEEL